MKFNPVSGERENFGFQNYDVVPDIVVMEKRNGWRNACGRFASTEMMDLLSDNPKLGHITTFGAPCHCVSLFSYTARNY
jgi:4-aminobutyrate aminotransferase-like enzyme